jgi:hypothetical protein
MSLESKRTHRYRVELVRVMQLSHSFVIVVNCFSLLVKVRTVVLSLLSFIRLAGHQP